MKFCSEEIRQAGGLAWPGLAKSDSASAWPDPGLEVSYNRTSSVIILLCSAWLGLAPAWLGLARPSSA